MMAMAIASTACICNLQLVSLTLERANRMLVYPAPGSHRLQVRIPLLVEVLVGVAHGLGLGAPDHDLKVDRLQAVVLVAVDDTRRTGDAFPRTQPCGEALAAFVLDKDVEVALQHEEALLDLMGVCRISLARLHIHDRQGKVLCRDHGRIGVLAGAAGADEAVLRAFVALDLGVLECRPVRLLLAKAPDKLLHDVLDRDIDQFRRARMSCDAHGLTPVEGELFAERMLVPSASSTTRVDCLIRHPEALALLASLEGWRAESGRRPSRPAKTRAPQGDGLRAIDGARPVSAPRCAWA